jgi:hypothetical protein
MFAWPIHSGRRASTRLLVVLIALVWGLPASLAEAAPNASLTRYPYLTDSIQSSVTVNWATTTAGTSGTVQWGPAGSCAANTTTATKKSISVNGVAEYQWKASLAVSPDTSYCYRVRLGTTDLLGTDPSPTFSSQVAAGSNAPFSFAVFGDWGQAYASSANADQANVLRQISTSGARFAVMTGDTAYADGSQKNYGDLKQTGTDISAVFGPSFWGVPGRSTPVFNVTGNHGFSNGAVQVVNWPEDNAASSSGGKYAMESYPSINGSTARSYPSFWYAFDAGRARFYVLTTAWADGNVGTGSVYANDAAAHWTPNSPEYKWLANDLATHPRSLKFAFWHYPIYADSSGQPSDTSIQGGNGTLQGLLNANNVNIAFNGHAHGYERNKPDPAGLVSYVFGNGGAALGRVSGCHPFDLYAIGSGASHCGAAPSGLSNDHVFGFAKVSVNGQQVTVTPTDELGRTYDIQTYTFPSHESDSQPPSVPANLTAAPRAPGSVSLSWSASTDDTGVTGYRVYRDGTLLTTLTGTATTYADGTVTPNTTYGYQVTALDAAGNESARQQTPVSVTTPGQTDTQAPTPPANLAATAPSGTQVNLTWTASTDDVGVDHYTVVRSGTALASASGTATTYTDESAAPGTTYTYSLRAIDAAGNASTASTVGVTTPPGAGTSSATFAALADASVKQASATSNFGTSTSLNSDSGSGVAMESYLRFNVTTVGTKTVQSAKLRLYVPSDGTSDGPGVYACTDPACATWTESGITWNSRPPRAGTPTSDVGAITSGRYVEWDVTPLISHDGTYTLVVGPTPTTDGTVFSSDEAAANKPQLVVTAN